MEINSQKYRLPLFLALNFSALIIGSILMGDGLSSTWFANLNQASWNPPGWVFGAAWTAIMISFSVYMSVLLGKLRTWNGALLLYLSQWCLNVAWNPAFFMFKHPSLSLLIISILTLLVGFILLRYLKIQGFYSLLILPYFLWLIVATSLNMYILLAN